MKYLRKAGKRQMPNVVCINKYYKTKKSDVTVNVPEGIKEIREMANLDSYYKVFLPKTLQKVNVRGIFSSYGSQRVFLGNHVRNLQGQ